MPMLSRIDLIKMQFYSTTTDTYTTCKELRGSYKTSEWFVLWKLPLPVGQLAVPLGSRKPIWKVSCQTWRQQCTTGQCAMSTAGILVHPREKRPVQAGHAPILLRIFRYQYSFAPHVHNYQQISTNCFTMSYLYNLYLYNVTCSCIPAVFMVVPLRSLWQLYGPAPDPSHAQSFGQGLCRGRPWHLLLRRPGRLANHGLSNYP